MQKPCFSKKVRTLLLKNIDSRTTSIDEGFRENKKGTNLKI